MKYNNILNYFRITFLIAFVITFQLSIVLSHSWKYIPKIPYRGKQEEYEKNKFTTDDDTNCKEFIYTAPLDHFSKDNTETFTVRYWVDMSCSKSGDSSPMFVQMGGEGAAGCVPCSDGLSQKYNGISVAVEHRFYGKSVPMGGLTSKNLPFLTVDQNLEDTKAIIEILNPNKKHRVITHGGSYSGGTASWFRTHYPDTTFASISSSGVVNALIDFVEFDESIMEALTNYEKFPNCLDSLLQVFDDIDQLSDDKLQDLKSNPFNASNLVSDVDFFYMVADAAAMAVQYGHKETLCKAMSSNSNPVALLAEFISSYYGNEFQSQPFYDRKQIANMISQSSTGVGAKSWRWQKCTQVAYLQSHDADSSSKGLRSKRLTQESLLEQCHEMFPDNLLDLKKQNKIFQKKYGAARPDLVGATRIFYSDYSDDPWKEASVKGPFKESLDLPYCFTKCDGCGHCGSGVPANLTKCTNELDKTIGKWLGVMKSGTNNGNGWKKTTKDIFKYPIMKNMKPIEERRYDVTMKKSSSNNLPETFDWRRQHGACIHPVLNQGQCGSCWAFAATEVLSDRFCLATNGSINVVLSPGDLLACEKLNLGCTMGSLPEWAFSYLKNNGVVSESCVPYVSGNGKTQKCTHGKCSAVSNKNNNITQRYYAESYKHCGSTISPTSHVNEIMQCIMEGGPVDVTFNVYTDFQQYTSGIYTHKSGKFEGLHSVKMIGWGHDDETGYDYWIVQNSWGENWGTSGFFKIRRGTNECGIERLVYAATPKL